MNDVVFELRFPDEPGPVPDKPVSVVIDDERFTEFHILCPTHDLRMRLVKNPKNDTLYYRCPNYTVTGCDGTVGAHRATGDPMGWPCDKETKKARQRAHKAFNPIWKSGYKSRVEAYWWMQKAMVLSREQAHIGKFDRDQCEKLIRLVKRDFPGL